MSTRMWILVLAMSGMAAACDVPQLPPPPDLTVVDATRAPPQAQAVTCSSKGSMETCPAGDYCVWYEGGGVQCRSLPAHCAGNATCACKPPLPNGTCECKDDGFGRIIVECH